jgi:DNA-directed RNA polymerase specialized sigma24 family protein
VVQEVFLTVFNGIRTFTKDGQPAAFRRWLHAITRYKVLEYWAAQTGLAHGLGGSGSRLDNIPDPGPTPDDSSGSPPKESSGIDGGQMREPDLPGLLEPIRSDWKAFWEHAVNERSAEDVAKELGIPPSAINMAVSRVLRCLREVTEDGVSVRVLLGRRLLELIRGEFEPRTWAAFWGVAAEGRSAKDVAKELGMRDGAVYTAKSRVLKRLREEAEALGFYFSEGNVVTADVAVAVQREVTS